jgi:heat shock protein HtpX
VKTSNPLNLSKFHYLFEMSNSLLKLRLSMLGTAALIIGVSTLGFTLIMSGLGGFSLSSLAVMVAIFNLLQWLLAPYLINLSYGVKPLDPYTNSELQMSIEDLSKRSGIKTPKLMISNLAIPNAFAYGSPLTGNHVAVTQGLLNTLNTDQVNAVIGHELGHIKHRDMHIMMMASFLPSLFYIFSRSMFFTRDRDNKGPQLIGAASLLIYFVLTLANLGLSRLREYYADQHSASLLPNNSKLLSEALAKISQTTGVVRQLAPNSANSGSFKTLFISDPDVTTRAGRGYGFYRSNPDQALVDEIKGRKLSGSERFFELFSTHPNIVKRLRALEETQSF